MSDVLSLQDALQQEAKELLARTTLPDLLSRLGEPIQTGSSVTGLMVYPDIDFTVQNAAPDFQDALRLIPRIYDELSPTALKVADFGSDANEPASYYIGFDFKFKDKSWHIDATVTQPGPITTNPPELQDWLDAMTDKQRKTILRLKKELIDTKRYVGSKSQPPYTFRSSHLYEGVVRGSAKTVGQLEAYFRT